MASHLRELGDDVVSIDREIEITDAVALLAAFTDAAPEAIYHLAALTHVGQSWDEPLRVLEVNVIGTGALLAAARQCGSDPRVLVTSSAEVYGAVTDPDLLPLREDSPNAPLGPRAGHDTPRAGGGHADRGGRAEGRRHQPGGDPLGPPRLPRRA